METKENNWKLQKLAFDINLHQALLQQHQAAQFVALVGRQLIPQQPDDSNTNMQNVIEKGLLIGNALPNGIRVALKLINLNVSILGQSGNTIKEISLVGKTRQEVFDELKQNLADLGIDMADFKNKLHYEIPVHELDNGAKFSINDKNDFIENANYRNNAEIIFTEIVKDFKQAEPVRIWPHHFDTGSFLPVSHNDKGELTKSIGMGWGIPDSIVDEPYYYLSFWSANPVEGLDKLKPLDTGNWMIPNWNGAILKHSEILAAKTANAQYEMVKSFYNSGIKILLDHLKG